MKKNKPALKAVLKIEYKDDSVLSHHLIEIILLALKLADIEDKDEIKRIQEDFLDRH